MIQNIKPINDCVVVEPIEVGVSQGGVVLPDAYKDKPQRGRVLGIGPGKLYDSGYEKHHEFWIGKTTYTKVEERRIRLHPDLKVGDTVLYGRYAGNEVELADGVTESRKVIIMREADLLGVEAE